MPQFRLRTIFIVMAVVWATCSLAPELSGYLVIFFVAFFSLVIVGRALLR